MRICAVSLPELRIEVARAKREGLFTKRSAEKSRGARGDASSGPLEREEGLAGPLAIVVAPAPMTEQKLLGNTRLDVVSREAQALGVRPGHTIAQARARASSLAVRVVRPDAVTGVLARLAEIALAFGATVAFDTSRDDETSYGDVVWVDVTGCAHLFAPKETGGGTTIEGEGILATRLAAVLEAQGHVCSVAVADGPRVAAILARCAARDRLVVPPGKNREALAPLSVAALPLPDADVRWLSKIGVRTIEELRELPRGALATRLGAHAAVVLALADGDDRAPLTPYVPPEIPIEECELEYGVESTDALAFVAKTLADRLAMRLAGRAVAAARIELELSLDAGMLSSEASKRDLVAIDLPAPLSNAADLLAALRPKIERLVLRAPVLSARLRAPSLVHKREAALSLFEAQPKADRALPRLVAELASDLGEEAVGKLALGDAWTPDDRSRFVRLAHARPRGEKEKKPHRLLSSVPEPTRVLSEPIPVPRDQIRIIRHLSRLELVDWWKRIPGDSAREKRGTDFVYAWTDDGPAWVEVDRNAGGARIRGWFD